MHKVFPLELVKQAYITRGLSQKVVSTIFCKMDIFTEIESTDYKAGTARRP